MKKILSSRLFWGLILIIGGALLLLNTFGLIEIGDIFWAVIMGVAGVLFLAVYITNRDHWWALIPGFILVTISATLWLDIYLPGFSTSNLIGPFILGGIALSFLLVYLADRGNWWAIIPAGVMATLVIVSSMDMSNSVASSGGIFFFGLGLTFALVAVLPNSVGPMRWAWLTAGILGLIGIILLVSRKELINYIWPSILIIAGALLIIRSFRRK